MSGSGDHRIDGDDAVAERNGQTLLPGQGMCIHCGGTGNEFLFMYHRCPECNGSGKVFNVQPLHKYTEPRKP